MILHSRANGSARRINWIQWSLLRWRSEWNVSENFHATSIRWFIWRSSDIFPTLQQDDIESDDISSEDRQQDISTQLRSQINYCDIRSSMEFNPIDCSCDVPLIAIMTFRGCAQFNWNTLIATNRTSWRIECFILHKMWQSPLRTQLHNDRLAQFHFSIASARCQGKLFIWPFCLFRNYFEVRMFVRRSNFAH